MDFSMEISVMVAANENGEVTTFPVAENIHTNHILDYSIVPARISSELQNQAEAGKRDRQKDESSRIAGRRAFYSQNGTLAVNELAPARTIQDTTRSTLVSLPSSSNSFEPFAACPWDQQNCSDRSPWSICSEMLGQIGSRTLGLSSRTLKRSYTFMVKRRPEKGVRWGISVC